ncbi:HET-domain-containing protein, partial [Tothia fuscella]
MESPYVCLSHCWGSGQSIPVTKKSNYADQLGGIAWETLPQTFQDAVVFARKLQIRYMWIDSLCIVQDDRSDWAENTANMASVYQNGYLTLAATSAEDSRGGLFYAGHSSEVAFRRKLPHFSDMESGHSTQRNKSAAGFPLLKRAWIYQERLLSPRILHFTHHELLWECLEGSICQCLLGSEPFSPSDSPVSPSRSPSSPGRINHLPQDCSIGLDGSDEASRLIAWHNILVKYSKLTITYHTDRLSALSGIAQQFGRPYASQYLAGMWKEQICYDLIWISLDAGSSPRPLNWSVPSWSWASIEGAV